MGTYKVAAVTVAAVLGVDALIHVYWMTGRTWPARDARTLSQVVLNTDVKFTPRGHHGLGEGRTGTGRLQGAQPPHVVQLSSLPPVPR